jgi:hypothetical protein
MNILTCVVTDGAAKDVQVSLQFTDCAGIVTFRLDAKSAKALAEALLKNAKEASSMLVMPVFDSTPPTRA